MERIFLIGYSGAGKTTLGRAYAHKFGLSFIDLDWYIEQRFHKTITGLFNERGEKGFRELEHKMLCEVSDFEDVVISCGGGTPCYADNIDIMLAKGKTVFLDSSHDTLFRRIKADRSGRPLLQGLDDTQLAEAIDKSLVQRRPFYEKAQYRIDSDLLENKRQIEECVLKLETIIH